MLQSSSSLNTRIWQLRSCPKCRGDRYLDISIEDMELVCVQCGHRVNAVPGSIPVRGRPFKSKFKQQRELASVIY